MNAHYKYEYFQLWDKECWKPRLSSIGALVYWIGENQIQSEDCCSPEYGRVPDNPTLLPGYNHKTGSADCPEVVMRWLKDGMVYRSLEMGGMRWIAMVPAKAFSREIPMFPY